MRQNLYKALGLNLIILILGACVALQAAPAIEETDDNTSHELSTATRLLWLEHSEKVRQYHAQFYTSGETSRLLLEVVNDEVAQQSLKTLKNLAKENPILVPNYFANVKTFLLAEMAKNPTDDFTQPLKHYQTETQLELPEIAFSKFNLNQLPDVVADFNDDESAAHLQISALTGLQLLLISTGNSIAATKQLSKSYYHLSRCLLAMETTKSFIENALLQESPNHTLPYNYDTPVCRGFSLQNIYATQRNAFVTSLDGFEYQLALQKIFPPLIEDSKTLKESKILNASVELRFDPTGLLLYTDNDQVEDGENYSDLIIALEQVVARRIESHSDLQKIFHFSNHPKVQTFLQTLVEEKKIEGPIERVLEFFRLAEVSSTFNLISPTAQDEKRIISFKSNIAKTLSETLKQTKVEAINTAVFLTTAKFMPADNKTTPEILTSEFRKKTVKEVVEDYFTELDSDDQFKQTLNALAHQIQNTPKTGIITYRKAAKDSIIAHSRLAVRYLDENTPPSELPHYRGLVLAQSGELLESMTPSTRARLNEYLGKSKSHEDDKFIYASIKSELTKAHQQKTNSDAQNKVSQDLVNLDILAAQLGLAGTTQEPRSLQEVLANIRQRDVDTEEFVEQYRQGLFRMLVGQHNVLDIKASIGGPVRPLYEVLGSQSRSDSAKNRFLESALKQTQENLVTTLNQIHHASEINHLKDVIQKSSLLAMALGANDLQDWALKSDINGLKGASQQEIFQEPVFPQMIQYQFKLKRNWRDQSYIRKLIGDQLIVSTSIMAMPLLYGWLARLGFQYLVPNALGGSWVAGSIRTASMGMTSLIQNYWQLLFIGIAVDLGIMVQRLWDIHRDNQLIGRMGHSHYGQRSGLSAQDRFALTDHNTALRKNYLFRAALDGFWLAFPSIAGLAMQKVLSPAGRYIARKREATLVKAEKTNNVPMKERLENAATSWVRYEINSLTKTLHHEFRELGLRPGDYSPFHLERALKRKQDEGNLPAYNRAKEAHDRIVVELYNMLAKYGEVERLQLIYIRQTLETKPEEIARLTKAYEKIMKEKGEAL